MLNLFLVCVLIQFSSDFLLVYITFHISDFLYSIMLYYFYIFSFRVYIYLYDSSYITCKDIQGTQNKTGYILACELTAPPSKQVAHMEMASCTEDTNEPVRMPKTAFSPKTVPATRGEQMTRAPGGIISHNEDLVEIAMHVS